MKDKNEYFDYTKCEHYIAKDVSPWHSDIFDHPTYESYCTKDGNEKISFPAGACKRCMEKGLNKISN